MNPGATPTSSHGSLLVISLFPCLPQLPQMALLPSFASTDGVGAADTFCTVLRGLQKCSHCSAVLWLQNRDGMGKARHTVSLHHFYPAPPPPSPHRQALLILQFCTSKMFSYSLFSCCAFLFDRQALNLVEHLLKKK